VWGWGHGRGMEEEPRFALRRGAVALTRRQWGAFVGVLVVGVVLAVVLMVAVKLSAGAIVLGLTAVALGLMAGIWRARIGP
jgi:hypothetical protein